MKSNKLFSPKMTLCFLVLGLCLAGGCFPDLAGANTSDAAQSDFIPWSGWWWPTNVGGLATGADYNGHPAPLEKYELYKFGYYPGNAVQYYLEHDYNPNALSWSGLCHAWAAAAVYEKIDFFPSSVDNVIFQIGDKKGLLTACHNHDQRLYANTEDPAVFHLWLLKYIKDEGQAFYAELDPSDEVWNFPVYRYEMETVETSGAINVTCKIWYASDFVHPDFAGTAAETETYTYSLFMSGGDITGGVWTGGSVTNHPQVLVLPLGLGIYNPYLDYEKVKEIAVSKDDPLESEEPTELFPGGYNLILMNDDIYRISAEMGESFFLSLKQMDDLESGIYVGITDGSGKTVRSWIISKEGANFDLLSENPPYTVTVSRPSYEDVGVYRLEFDQKKVYSFYNPNIQKGFGWGGLAITNNGASNCETVFVTGYTRAGRPMETYAGPFSLAPGQKKVIQVSDFRIRMIERDALFGVKVQASQPVEVLNLTGYYGKNMSSMGKTAEGTTFVIPEIQAGFNVKRTISWGLYNSSLEKAGLTLTHYAAGGGSVDEYQGELSCNEVRHYSGTELPFKKSVDGGWVSVDLSSSAPVGGYWQWLKRDLTAAESLPLLAPANEFVIPHVADTAGWKMNLVLINTEASTVQVNMKLLNGGVVTEREVNFSAKEKKTLSIASFFSNISKSVLNQSAVSISASGKMAGYYTFETAKDALFFPLPAVETAKREFIVPHVASSGYWWTCVNLVNPSESESALISFVPYDANGNLIPSGILKKRLNARSKDVFTVASRWNKSAGQIGSIRIMVEEGPPVIGIYAYGNADFSMLAGNLLD